MKKLFILALLCLASTHLHSQESSFRFQIEATGSFGVAELPRTSLGVNAIFTTQVAPYTLIGLGTGFSSEVGPWGFVQLNESLVRVDPQTYHIPVFFTVSFGDVSKKVFPILRLDLGYSFDVSSPKNVFDDLDQYIDTKGSKLDVNTSGAFGEPHIGLGFKGRSRGYLYVLACAPLHLREIYSVKTELLSSVGFKLGYAF